MSLTPDLSEKCHRGMSERRDAGWRRFLRANGPLTLVGWACLGVAAVLALMGLFGVLGGVHAG